MSDNYKDTVFLPKTDFPMRGNLPEREPALVARWEKMGLYRRMRDAAAGREKFILHDGPPYANGPLHIGHALNKILKDIINRSQQMLGRDAAYVPGWDCHGLPIEWKIEEKYRKEGKDKDDVPVIEFREECRQFAAHWMDVQREEFKRLGVMGDWENPYTTMVHASEAGIVEELCRFVQNGGLYKGARPVMWSPVEKTTLAEAEVEYHDHQSTFIYVGFPLVDAPDAALEGASVVIWTTTPWTIPGNRAVAYGPDIDYVVISVTDVADGAALAPGARLVMSDALSGDVAAACGITGMDVVARIKGAALAGAVLHHPLYEAGYEFGVPLLPGDHVTVEQGTGFVHTAPGHGVEDFAAVRAFNASRADGAAERAIEIPQTVGPDGVFYDHVKLFAGTHVYKADGPVCEALENAGALLASGKITHSYPHSWRSKAPLIYRNTPQWFISMDTNDLRQKALAAIDKTAFYPETGRNRLQSMVEGRPDWCVSRQRAWGVPITVFTRKETGKVLRDEAVNARIVAAVHEEGADAWFISDPARFLGPDYNPDEFEQVMDILDVWFDSGSTHAFVLEQRDDLASPAQLYLEGSDQHRGWFQSSLLESCGTRGRAPFEGVLTHGFVLAESGDKMSKSQGNTLSPQDVMKSHGADILRLWVVASDYGEDLSFGPNVLKQQADAYRRLRNTFRFLLGNLDGFTADERVPAEDMPELERWVLHRLSELDEMVRAQCAVYDFHAMFTALHRFCAVELSAFYFDIRKDALYCDRADSILRRSSRTVLDAVFDRLVTWLAPVIAFTAEEVWQTRYPDETDSVHLQSFPDTPDGWRDAALAEKWEKLRQLRRVVTGALEVERAEKRIGSSLESAPKVYVSADYMAVARGSDLAELVITSGVDLIEGVAPEGAFHLPDVPGIGVVPVLSDGTKCGRCYKLLPDVGSHTGYEGLCGRCVDAVGAHRLGAA